MEKKSPNNNPIPCAIEPWLTVQQGEAAVSFYKAALGATESYRMEAQDGGLVVKLTVEGASFWLSGDPNSEPGTGSAASGNGSIRMIVSTTNPDAVFAQALKAGATQIFPVGEEYGWRLGRLEDPFGYHWEIGRQLE